MSIEDDKLKVSEISDSGLDGVLIKIDGVENYVINFGGLSQISENSGVLKTTTLKRNPLGQVVIFFESFKWSDKEINRVLPGYNLNFFPESFNVFGSLNGKSVFEIKNTDLILPKSSLVFSKSEIGQYSTPIPPIGPILAVAGLVLAVVGIGVTIWAALKTKKTTTVIAHRDKDGNHIGYSIILTEDPVPFEVEVNGKTYTVDEIGVKYDINFPSEFIGNPTLEYSTVAEQITGYRLSSFEITSIEVSLSN